MQGFDRYRLNTFRPGGIGDGRRFFIRFRHDVSLSTLCRGIACNGFWFVGVMSYTDAPQGPM